MNNNWITGKVAIVTGGASGIGQGIAIEAAQSGAVVVIADVNEEQGRDTIRQLEKENGQGVFVKTDVRDTSQIKNLVRKATELGEVKYLANSAGIQTYGISETTSEETWDHTMDINLKSMFLVSKEVIPVMRKNGGGGIVHISSIQGLKCQKNVLAYATSKGAVIALTRSMGIDHAHENIFVNCLCPGSIDTPMLRYGAAEHGDVETVIKEWGKNHPIGRIGTPEEIAKTTMFLWSPDSNFIVGQAIAADGGLGSVIF